MTTVARCPDCARPMDAAVCSRCTGDVDALVRAIREATDGRVRFTEAYALAKRVAAREQAEGAFLRATAEEFRS